MVPVWVVVRVTGVGADPPVHEAKPGMFVQYRDFGAGRLTRAYARHRYVVWDPPPSIPLHPPILTIQQLQQIVSISEDGQMRFKNDDAYELFGIDCPVLFFKDTPFGELEGPASTAGTKDHLFAVGFFEKPHRKRYRIIPGESQQVTRQNPNSLPL